MNKLLTLALIVLLFSAASSYDTNVYIRKNYPDDKKLSTLKAPLGGIVFAMVLIILSGFIQ